MPSTSLINSVRALFNSKLRNLDNSNPLLSFQVATRLPSYKYFTKNHMYIQQPDIFNSQYRIEEHLVYSFIATSECS